MMNDAEREVCVGLLANLNAAVSLLERGGKKAAASDKMFEIMLDDYRKSIEAGRQMIAGSDAAFSAPVGAANASGIPVEASIAWQAGAFNPLHPKNAVMVEGRSWYRDDHPRVQRKPPPP